MWTVVQYRLPGGINIEHDLIALAGGIDAEALLECGLRHQGERIGLLLGLAGGDA